MHYFSSMSRKLYNWEYAPYDSKGYNSFIPGFILVIAMWLVFWLNERFYLDFYQYGIFPRSLEGLSGILLSPFIHGDLSHIANNTLPMIVLSTSLYFFYARKASLVLVLSIVLSGAFTWIVGRESYHIGASGLIYALAFFILASGIIRKQSNLLAISLLVIFLYGGLVWGIFPVEESISWEAHLGGAVTGVILSYIFRDYGPPRKEYDWESEEEEEMPAWYIEMMEEKKLEQEEKSAENAKFTYIYKPSKNDSEPK